MPKKKKSMANGMKDYYGLMCEHETLLHPTVLKSGVLKRANVYGIGRTVRPRSEITYTNTAAHALLTYEPYLSLH